MLMKIVSWRSPEWNARFEFENTITIIEYRDSIIKTRMNKSEMYSKTEFRNLFSTPNESTPIFILREEIRN